MFINKKTYVNISRYHWITFNPSISDHPTSKKKKKKDKPPLTINSFLVEEVLGYPKLRVFIKKLINIL